MNKKFLGKIILILVIITVFTANVSFATKGWNETMKASSKGITSEVKRTEEFGNGIIGVIQIVGVTAGVITLMTLGLRYMMAAPSEKADVKKTAIIYIIGAILMFSASGILGVIRTFALNIK